MLEVRCDVWKKPQNSCILVTKIELSASPKKLLSNRGETRKSGYTTIHDDSGCDLSRWAACTWGFCRVNADTPTGEAVGELLLFSDGQSYPLLGTTQTVRLDPMWDLSVIWAWLPFRGVLEHWPCPQNIVTRIAAAAQRLGPDQAIEPILTNTT